MTIYQWLYRNVYLKTPHWRKVAKLVKARDMNQCQVRGCNRRMILDAHHTRYKIWIFPILFLEQFFLFLLVTLCRDHHNDTHNGIDLMLRNGKKLKAFK